MKPKREIWYVLLAYIIITFAIFWKVVVNFSGAVPGAGGAVYLQLFYLWSTPHSVLISHGSPYFTNDIFYPIGGQIPSNATAPLAGIISYPLQLINKAIAYNVFFFAAYILGAILMYILLIYLTKNKTAAFAGGAAFAFIPIHLVQSSIGAVSIEFLPLLLLFVIRAYREKSAKLVIYSAITLAFAAFFGSILPGGTLLQRLSPTVTLIAALLVGLVVVQASKKRKVAGTYLAAAVTAVLIVNGIIFSFQESIVSAAAPIAYTQLSASKTNFSMLILPVLPNYSSPDPWYYQKLEAYYQAIAGKPTVNGYAAKLNQSQEIILTSIPLSVEANYLSTGQGFAYSSPIQENYSNVTILWLAADNIGVVSIVRQAYNYSEQQQLLSYLDSLLGSPIYQDNSTSMFSTAAAISEHAGKSLVAYPTGTWVPGYAICSSQQCSAAFVDTWWGGDARGIALFAPQNVSSVQMSFEALSGSGSAGVYLFNGNQQVLLMNLTSNATRSYSLSIPVHGGYNYLVFAKRGESNATLENEVSIDYGIRNITFTPTK